MAHKLKLTQRIRASRCARCITIYRPFCFHIERRETVQLSLKITVLLQHKIEKYEVKIYFTLCAFFVRVRAKPLRMNK